MATLEYIFGDLEAAKSFVSELNRKVVRRRFSGVRDWQPHHLVLAKVDGRYVAMADCIVSNDGGGANVSLLARPKYGAYAVLALIRLKRIVPVNHWESTLRLPTPATVAISRRYLDSTFDQATWELSNALMAAHGVQAHFQPTPIITSDSYLRLHRLPPIRSFSPASRAQIIDAALNPSENILYTPSDDAIPGPLLMALAFDVLETPMETRQHVTRAMMLSFAAMHGHDVSAATELVSPEALPDFTSSILNADKSNRTGAKLFKIEPAEGNVRGTLTAL